MRFALVSLWAVSMFAAVQNKVQDKFLPAAAETQKIDGLLGERLRVNLEGRLLHVDEEALLNGFEHRPGKHPWIGEHIGKYLHAASLTYRQTHNAQLKTNMDRMVKRLIATQLPDGYLGTYADDQRWTSWDVWSHKYDLIGLLSYYDITGDKSALRAASKVGDLLSTTFGIKPGQRDIIAASTHVGMAATSVLEPICQLYRATGNKRYLDFANYLVDNAWNQGNGPKIVKSLLNTRSVYRTANAKAYEMTSNLVGVVELYRLTGRKDLWDAATIAWQDIRDHHLYITGTTSSAEHFQEDGFLPGDDIAHVGEGCETVSWVQLNWQLLRLTGEAKYAEELERTVYNQLLGAQDPHNGNICYFTPLNGTKNATVGINCCVSSEPRGIAMIPSFTLGSFGNGVAVELYTPGVAKLQAGSTPVMVTVTTDYPKSGDVQLTVQPQHPASFPVYLRVPAWSKSFEASAGSSKWQGKAGEYLKLERKWDGSPLSIKIDLSSEYLDGGKSYPGFVAVRRGPQILALDAKLNPELPLLQRSAPKVFAQPMLHDVSTKAPIGWGGSQLYSLAGVAVVRDAAGAFVKADRDLILAPFADAYSYRIWLPKPERLTTAPPSLAAGAKEIVSKADHLESFADERTETYLNVSPDKSGLAWCGVELLKSAAVKRVVFKAGPSGFAGTPEVQVQRTPKGAWETAGMLSASAELQLAHPVDAVAVRIAGKPSGSSASCAEVEVY